jgi:hypothetical protein
MAIITTSTAKTVQVVYSADPSVALDTKAATRRKAAQLARVRRVVGDNAVELDKAEAAPLEPCFVGLDECKTVTGATTFRVRALSWLEYQEAEALPAEAQIMRNIELGLVDIDGDREAAAKFRTDPVASLVVPLYRAIVDLTWGNLPGS